MLTDSQLELISLAVDGELSPSEEVAFRELLAESADAVRRYQSLRTMAESLAALKPKQAPASVEAKILAGIRKKKIRPKSLEPQRTRPGWVPYAIAASTLLAVMAGSFWVATRPTPEVTEYARQIQLPKITPTTQPNQDLVSVARPAEVEREVIPAPREVVAIAQSAELAPSPRSVNSTSVLGSGDFTPTANITALDSRLPVLLPASELAKSDAPAKFLAELKSSPARLDLFTRDTGRGTETLLAAFKKANISVIQDPITVDRLKKNPTLAFAVYTDSLNSQELAQLLKTLGTVNQDGDKPLATAHLSTLTETDSKDLSVLLGVEMNLTKPTKPATGTVAQLTTSLGKQNQAALLFTFLPQGLRGGYSPSAMVKNFAQLHKDRTASQQPLLIIIRPLGQ
ncbi:MAG: hypothetical protein ACRC8S_14405 [Fimbriiglobus sp.]